jgi:magnesium transporter
MSEFTAFDIEVAAHYPEEVARLLEHTDVKACAHYLRALPAPIAARLGAYLSSYRWLQLLHTLDAEMVEMLEQAELRDALVLLNRFPADQRAAIVNRMGDASRRRELARFLAYPDHCVGAIVKSPTAVCRQTATRSDLVEELRAHNRGNEIYAVAIDHDARYIGVVDPWQLLLKCPDDGSIAHCLERVPGLRPERIQEDVALLPIWATRTWLPVVDREQRVLGIIRHNDLRSVHAAAPLETVRLADSVYEGLGELTDIVLRKGAP